jgi:hypothetical protein
MGEGKLKDLMGEPSAVFRSVNLDFNENGIGGEKTAPGATRLAQSQNQKWFQRKAS